jgi:hypothetical protein
MFFLKTVYPVLVLLSISVSGWARDVKYLNFSAKNKYDIYVRDLKLEEIEVEIDGKPVEIGFFGSQDVQTSFVVLLENSPRTAKYAVSMPQWGQINPIDRIRFQMYYDFFPQMTDHGSVLLGEFAQEIKILQEFTSHPDVLARALHEMRPNHLDLSINDPEVGRAVGRGVDWLKDRRDRRKFLILFTTHIDRESYGNLDEYRDMLREVDVEVYVISWASRNPTGLGRSFEEKMNRYFFQKLVDETSGWLYLAGAYTYLDELFTDLKGRLFNNYTIGLSVDSSGPPREHEVRIRILREKCRVTHRKVIIF